MLDIKFIRENPSQIQKAAESKGITVSIDHLLEIDRKYRELSLEVQTLREERNKYAKEKNIEKGRELKEKLEKDEHVLSAIKEELDRNLREVPLPPLPDVTNEDIEIKKVGEPKKFDFKPKDHLDLGESLDIIDVQRAAKVSGTRFAYLKNEGVLLEFALVQFAMETLRKEGFTPVIPPVLIKKEITDKLGYWNGGGNEDYYLVVEPGDTDTPKELFYLIGTAEHALVPMHEGEVLNKKDLPKRYVGFSSAFRREAGTYGKDTRGILRVHQFDKVEMISYTTEENDSEEHEALLSIEEKLFQALKIPYRVVKIKIMDLGFPIAKKYDIEAWLPGQDQYREMTSVSTTLDFQARRLNIKYQDGPEKKYTHILNGTAFAIGRTIIAILENYQQEDGSVLIPEVLQKYLPKTTKITPKK